MALRRPEPPFGTRPVQFVDVFPKTRDGKVDLCPPHLDAEAPLGLYGYQPDPATEQYPLALISPSSDRTISSTLGELPGQDAKLLMHPDDAQKLPNLLDRWNTAKDEEILETEYRLRDA